MAANKIKVSFIIPSWNRLVELKRLVYSIQQQRCADFEVWVVDNGSTDGSAEFGCGLEEPFHLIANQANIGPAAARNQAIVKCRSELIWFLDSDSELAHPEVLAQAVALMDAYPDIGALGGEINLDRQGLPFYRVKYSRANGETKSRIIRDREVLIEECDYLPTCNCLTRRELLLRWGGFNPDYFILSEDNELGAAIRRFGLRNIFDSRVQVIHHITEATRTGNLFIKHKNRLRFVLLNGKTADILLLPWHDLTNLLNRENIKSVEQAEENPQVAKYMRSWMKRMISSPYGKWLALTAVGAEYGAALIWAYCYHLWHLNRTLNQRRERPDFLARII